MGAGASTTDEAWAQAPTPLRWGDAEVGGDEAADSQAGWIEGDAEDPATKATRREGLN